MSCIKSAIIFVVAFLLQPIVTSLFGLLDIGTNLVLCVAITMTLLFGDKLYILVLSFAGGLLYDICYSQFNGSGTLGIIIAVAGVLVIRYFFNSENMISVPIVALWGTVIYNFIYWYVYHLSGSIYQFTYMLKYLPYDFVITLITVFLLYIVLRKSVVKHKNDYRVR